LRYLALIKRFFHVLKSLIYFLFEKNNHCCRELDLCDKNGKIVCIACTCKIWWTIKELEKLSIEELKAELKKMGMHV
jgi:hypothetical protein